MFPHPAGIRVSAGVNRVAHSVTGPFTNGPYSGPHLSTLADTEARSNRTDTAITR